jgi:hypothetical protein
MTAGDGAGLDSVAELEALRRENTRLRKLLKLTDAESAPAHGTQTAWFDKAPGPVDNSSSPQVKVAFYAALFGARRDVYAVRRNRPGQVKPAWYPATAGRWVKGGPPPANLPLTPGVLADHLLGRTHIGLYPMLPGDQTCWLAADFDGQAAMLDALAYLKAARALGAPAALEVSSSGIGAHVWIFFTDPVPAAAARVVGTGLVRPALPSPRPPAGSRIRKPARRTLARRVPQARDDGLPRSRHPRAVRGPVGLPLHPRATHA